MGEYMICENCGTNYYVEEGARTDKCFVCGERSIKPHNPSTIPNYISIINEKRLKDNYDKLKHHYATFCEFLRESLDERLKNENIAHLDVVFRIKKFDEVLKKAKKKNYHDPLEEMNDICGLRIICFYKSDLKKITQIIREDFKIIEYPPDPFEHKRPDQFEYQSLHFVVRVADTYSEESLDKDNAMKHVFKAEIQVRTVLMHAWAAVSHELVYKHPKTVSSKLKHDLNRLSAVLEVADDQFDLVKQEQREYIEKYFIDDENFNLGLEMNSDTLLAFLDFCFPEWYQSIKDTKFLFIAIIRNNETPQKPKITFKNLFENYKKYAWLCKKEHEESHSSYKFNQAEFMDVIMCKSEEYDWPSCFGA